MTDAATPSTEIPMERLGPAGIRGELHVLAIMENEQRNDYERLRDVSERQFKVASRLSKAPPAAEDIKGDFTADDGGSFLLVSEGALFSRVRCPEGMFEVKKNQAGENSLIEFSCVATSTTDARKKFQAAVLPFLDYLSYLANSPLFIAALRIEDPKNDRTSLEYVSPYRKVTVNPHMREIFSELRPVYAMYREAKNSYSDFYKFLCYHKIIEGLLGPLRAGVYQRARERGVTLHKSRDMVPSSPHIDDRYKQYIEKPVKVFFDSVLTPQFRNAVAHFVTDDGAVLNMSASEHIESYASILYASELCVRVVVESHEHLLKHLEPKP